MNKSILIASSSAVFAMIGVFATRSENGQSAFAGAIIFAFIGLGIGAYAARQR